MLKADCNPPPAARMRCVRLIALSVCGLAIGLTSCATGTQVTRVSLRALEIAPAHQPRRRIRTIVADVAALGPLYHPLNQNLGIVQVRSIEDWRRLNLTAPQPGPPPDFSRGIVVGVLSRAGTPIDDGWPASIQSVQLVESAGLLISRFHSGCYLPDTTAYLESVYVEGLSTLLVVDVDDLRFFIP